MRGKTVCKGREQREKENKVKAGGELSSFESEPF